MDFDKMLVTLKQTSGANTGRLSTEGDRASFQVNVKTDLASLIYAYNYIIYPAFYSLRSGPLKNDVLVCGLEGRTITTYGEATENSDTCYWNSAISQPASIKETFDCLLSQIATLQNSINKVSATSSTYDDSVLTAAIACLSLNLAQLAEDTLGPDYTLSCDGNPDLMYSLARHVEEIGTQLINGFPGTGLTFTGEPAYPALSLTVRLSQIILDTTLDQVYITDLPADLNCIRTFIGAAGAGDCSPTYTDWVPSLCYIADAMSLEEAVAVLDNSIETILGDNVGGGAELYKDKIAGVNPCEWLLRFRSLTSTSTHVVLTPAADTIDLDVSLALDDLTDVNAPAPVAGQVLTYVGPNWEAVTPTWNMGYHFLLPDRFIGSTEAPINIRDPGPPIIPIVQGLYDYLGGTVYDEELSFKYVAFITDANATDLHDERIMTTISNSSNESGLHATALRIIAHFVLPDTWAGGAGGNFAFRFQVGEGGVAAAYGCIPDGKLLIHGEPIAPPGVWGPAIDKQSSAVPAGEAGLTHYQLDSGLIALNPSSSGPINIRIGVSPPAGPPYNGIDQTGEFALDNATVWFIGTRVTFKY